MTGIVALFASYIFIFAIIGVSQLLLVRRAISPSVTRKIVHIGVAHWWFFAMYFMDSLALALIGPVSFIAINYISYKRHVFKAMEHEIPEKNLGTIYFPIALTILVILTWAGPFPKWYGLLAILVLGWGDGMASLIGESIGSRDGALRFPVAGGEKSVAGSAAMMIAAGSVATILVWLYTGPLAATTGTVGVGFGLWRRMVTWFMAAAEQTWIARPTDTAVVNALGRLDAVARIVAERIAGYVPVTTGVIDPATWNRAPTTIAAIGLLVAATAALAELATPRGLDNITVPLVAFTVVAVVLPLPSEWIVRAAWALGLNLRAASVAYLRRSIAADGAAAAVVVGFLIYVAGGVFYWALLMAFFASSTALGKLGKQRKHDARSLHTKGEHRDAIQVLANGGFATLMAVLHALSGRPIFMLGFAIALAAANADTWASEVGVLSSREPVNILTGKRVSRGTSGGISALGLLASAGGALFIALCFAAGYWITTGWNGVEMAALVAAVAGGGFLGSVVDSVLGATIQAQYWDSIRRRHTERPRNAQGLPNRLVRGFHVVTNDAVNALSGAIGSLVLIGLVV